MTCQTLARDECSLRAEFQGLWALKTVNCNGLEPYRRLIAFGMGHDHACRTMLDKRRFRTETYLERRGGCALLIKVGGKSLLPVQLAGVRRAD